MTDKPWVPNKPEQRLSIAVDRFLGRALLPPCYFTAIHDADEGGRTDQQRARDRNRGIKSGQLDWIIVQGPGGLVRSLELKRGRNRTSVNQDTTIAVLAHCGAPPVVAWTLVEAYRGLLAAGFRFAPNVGAVLQHMEAELAGWDREAEAIKSGAIVRRRSTAAPKARKKPGMTWILPI